MVHDDLTAATRLIRPIAVIHTDFTDKFGLPRQSGRVPSLMGRVVFEKPYRDPEALREITSFSHLWLLFDFSRAHQKEWSTTVRPPRLGGNRRVGVFASRSPFRPNSIGLSCVKLDRVERSETEGDVLLVSGVDLLDGTPIYDIKPYLPYADAPEGAVGGYAEAHRQDRLEVCFPEPYLRQLPEEKRQAAVACLAEDPRPSYHEPGREYGMSFAGFNIRFSVKDNTLTVLHMTKE